MASRALVYVPYRVAMLGGVRRWVFLPMLMVAVPIPVLVEGGDVLGVCFNTIAIVFLTEVTC
jgi:hypothetical protein